MAVAHRAPLRSPSNSEFFVLQPSSNLRARGTLWSNKSYWAKFWRVDQRGIYDMNKKTLVLSILNPDDEIKSARAAFTEQKVTTAQEYSTKQVLTYNMIFKHNGKEIYHLEVDQSDRRRGARVTKLVVTSPSISDAAGVSAGNRLIDVAGYNWKRLCEEYQAQVNCRSPYSSNVSYNLENDVLSGKDSIQSVLTKYRVKEIEVRTGN